MLLEHDQSGHSIQIHRWNAQSCWQHPSPTSSWPQRPVTLSCPQCCSLFRNHGEMAQTIQSLDPGSAACAVADQDAVESLVVIPLLQQWFYSVRGQHMPFAHEAELKIS